MNIVSGASFTTGFTLTSAVTTVLPFNLVIASNAAGLSTFNTATGVFTVAESGPYRVDYNVAFLLPTATAANSSLQIAVRQNLTSASSSIFTQPQLTATTNIFNISSYYIGDFVAGDSIAVTALASIAGIIVLGPAFNAIAPYNTNMIVTSLF